MSPPTYLCCLDRYGGGARHDAQAATRWPEAENGNGDGLISGLLDAVPPTDPATLVVRSAEGRTSTSSGICGLPASSRARPLTGARPRPSRTRSVGQRASSRVRTACAAQHCARANVPSRCVDSERRERKRARRQRLRWRWDPWRAADAATAGGGGTTGGGNRWFRLGPWLGRRLGLGWRRAPPITAGVLGPVETLLHVVRRGAPGSRPSLPGVADRRHSCYVLAF